MTDHVGVGMGVKTQVLDSAEASKMRDIPAVPGAEVTLVPKDDICMVA